jgi:monomeric isocitrate dehydrogenase
MSIKQHTHTHTLSLSLKVLDASFMSIKQLIAFYEKEISEAQSSGVLLSLHLKATMMKVLDPILFGHMTNVSSSSYDTCTLLLIGFGSHPLWTRC